MRAVIDSHVHFWQPQQLRYLWLDEVAWVTELAIQKCKVILSCWESAIHKHIN